MKSNEIEYIGTKIQSSIQAFHQDYMKKYNENKNIVIRKMDKTSKYTAKKNVGMCCIGGKVILPVLQVLPMDLVHLYDRKYTRIKTVFTKYMNC